MNSSGLFFAVVVSFNILLVLVVDANKKDCSLTSVPLKRIAPINRLIPSKKQTIVLNPNLILKCLLEKIKNPFNTALLTRLYLHRIRRAIKNAA